MNGIIVGRIYFQKAFIQHQINYYFSKQMTFLLPDFLNIK